MDDCREVQRLLRAGVRPAARPLERAFLGFHIANCPNCHALLQELNQQEHLNLLETLLAEDIAEPVVVPVASSRSFARRGFALLGLFLLLGLGLWWGLFRQTSTPATALEAATPIAVATLAQPTIQPPLASTATIITSALIAPSPTATAEVPPTTIFLLEPTSAPPPLITMNPATTYPAPLEQPNAPPLGTINILLLGLDRRPGETAPSRSDSLIVLSINPMAQSVAMLSLPRDLWVTLPEPYSYPVKINAAYQSGEEQGGAAEGAEVARKTVSSVIGQPIDYVMVTTFEGLIKTVDRLQGIEVNVEKEIYDASYPTFDYGYMVAHFLPGQQTMDGETALIYSRTRHADNDFERGKRQQQVLIAIAVKLRQQLQNSDFISQLALINDLQSDLEYTNLDAVTLGQLAVLMPKIEPEDVRRDSIDLRYGYETSTYDGAYIIEPDLPAIQQLTTTLFSGQ